MGLYEFEACLVYIEFQASQGLHSETLSHAHILGKIITGFFFFNLNSFIHSPLAPTVAAYCKCFCSLTLDISCCFSNKIPIV